MDKTWQERVLQFGNNHPEFLPYLIYAPRSPNLIWENPMDKPINVFEMILYCMASAGCRAKYGLDLYLLLRNFWRVSFPSTEFPFRLTDKQRLLFEGLITHMLFWGLTPTNLDVSAFHTCQMETIKGIGPTTISKIHQYFLNDYTLYPHTDRGFLTGFTHIYGKHTKKQRLEILSKLSDPQVATFLIDNIYTYHVKKYAY